MFMNDQLAKRERIDSKDDKQLASQFGKLCTNIDQISQADWKRDIAANPFWETLNKTPMEARQLLLEHIIWITLFKKMFASPFRVLGVKGKALEEQWKNYFQAGESSKFDLDNRRT